MSPPRDPSLCWTCRRAPRSTKSQCDLCAKTASLKSSIRWHGARAQKHMDWLADAALQMQKADAVLRERILRVPSPRERAGLTAAERADLRAMPGPVRLVAERFNISLGYAYKLRSAK